MSVCRAIWLLALAGLATGLAARHAAADSAVDDRQAKRAANLFTTTNVNLRSGPGTAHGKTAVIPAGQIVSLRGCVSGYAWCRVDWSGERGWVYTKTLTRPRLDGRFRDYAEGLGVPLEVFEASSSEPAEPAGARVIVQRIGTGAKGDRLDGPMSFAGDTNGDLLGGDIGLQKSTGR